MSKYIKLEDAIYTLYSGFVSKSVIEDKLKGLPTIEVSEDAISREYIVKELKTTKEFYLSAWEGFSNMDDKDKARCDELNSCIATVINAPSVIPKRSCYRCGLREDCENSTERKPKERSE